MSFGRLGTMGRGFGRLGGPARASTVLAPLSVGARWVRNGNSFDQALAGASIDDWTQLYCYGRYVQDSIGQMAVGGQSLDDYLGRLDNVEACAPHLHFVGNLVNDIIADRTTAECIADLEIIIERGRNPTMPGIAPYRIFLVTSPWWTTITAGRDTVRQETNAWMLSIAGTAGYEHVMVGDVDAVLPQADNAINTREGLHPNTRGAQLGGIANAAGLLNAAHMDLTTDPYPTTGNVVPFDMSGTTGTVGTGISGQVATGWTSARTASLASGTSRNVTGATQASPCVITTSVAHGYATNMAARFASVGGMTELNGREEIITVLSSTTFSIPVDSTGFTTYTSGGTVIPPGVSKTNPVVARVVNHGGEAGSTATFSSVGGMTQLNGNTYTAANVTTDTFQLSGIDGTAFGTWTSGGTIVDAGVTMVASKDTLNGAPCQVFTLEGTAGWTIPDYRIFQIMTVPASQYVGAVNEDWYDIVVESAAGGDPTGIASVGSTGRDTLLLGKVYNVADLVEGFLTKRVAGPWRARPGRPIQAPAASMSIDFGWSLYTGQTVDAVIKIGRPVSRRIDLEAVAPPYFQNVPSLYLPGPISGTLTVGSALHGQSGYFSGKGLTLTYDWERETGAGTGVYASIGRTPIAVTNITQATTGRVTAAGHGLVNGQHVLFAGVGGMTQLNGNWYSVKRVDDDNFDLYTFHSVAIGGTGGTGLNTTGYGAYTSGGTADPGYTYAVVAADTGGKRVRMVTTATNSLGTASAAQSPSGAIA